MASDKQLFSKWRAKIWPIHRSELSKFLPLFFMKFCVSFNYTVLNATKDTVTVTCSEGGAEIIPVLKGGVVIAIAFLVMLIYSKLSNKLSRTSLFYTVLAPFLVFFLVYGTVLFPYRHALIPEQSSAWLVSLVGEAHQHWIAVYRYWMNSAFFVLAELWGGMMIGVLFWGFANQITNVKDAARFYALYTAGGHLGTIGAGSVIFKTAQPALSGSFENTVQGLMFCVVAIGLLIMALYWWTNRFVVSRPEFKLNLPDPSEELNSKTQLSLRESLSYIFRSPYLGLIALMVVGYGVSVNMVEVSWKAILKIQFPDPSHYQAYMGVLQSCLGFVSLFIALFIGGNIIRGYGWHLSAQLTPIVLGTTSLVFFLVFFAFPDFRHDTTALMQVHLGDRLWVITPLMLLVLCGTLHNIACKAMKYCLFDPTKEMAYIPLDKEAKIKGKAAVDLVGGRFGKSGASWVQLGLIDWLGAGSILGVVPLLLPCVLGFVAMWAFAVHRLNKRFENLQKVDNLKSSASGVSSSTDASVDQDYVPA